MQSLHQRLFLFQIILCLGCTRLSASGTIEKAVAERAGSGKKGEGAGRPSLILYQTLLITCRPATFSISPIDKEPGTSYNLPGVFESQTFCHGPWMV